MDAIVGVIVGLTVMVGVTVEIGVKVGIMVGLVVSVGMIVIVTVTAAAGDSPGLQAADATTVIRIKGNRALFSLKSIVFISHTPFENMSRKS
jgi:hypothetical protein